MKEVVLVIGAVLLIGGIGIGVWGSGMYHDTWMPGHMDEEEEDHDHNLAAAVLGFPLAAIGVVFMVYGLVAKEPVIRSGTGQMPIQQPLAPDATNFCQYCGHQTARDAEYCPACGRHALQRP